MNICVPQGSCIGPQFYLIFANHIFNNIIIGVKNMTFADDLHLILNGGLILVMKTILI